MASLEPGWHPDPDHPTTLVRYWDGAGWTDRTAPTGYVVQPAGPEPVVSGPRHRTPVFGATPPETGGPPAARRRLRAAETAVVVTVVLGLVVLGLALAGVL